MKIDINSSLLSIGGITIDHPYTPIAFEKILGKANEISNSKDGTTAEYHWHNEGINAMFETVNNTLTELRIKLMDGIEFDFIENNSLYKGELIIEGQDYLSYLNISSSNSIFKDFEFGNFKGTACLDDNNNIEAILFDPIRENQNVLESDKYEIKAIENSIIEFSDFNFKLAVVQQLMYDMDLLKPKFDLQEFIEYQKEKTINPNEYEYKLIPEVKEYFEKLPIPITLLEQVEEINQDGGNEIYMNVTGLWDGEDEMFNIRSTEDLQFVPNLKSITLFYDEDEGMVDKFEEKGIESEYL